MHFRQLSLENFGPFAEFDVKFAWGELNIVYGENGSGKTQLLGALLSAVCGRPALRFNESGTAPSSVLVQIGSDDYLEEVTVFAGMDSGNILVRHDATVLKGAKRPKFIYQELHEQLQAPAGPEIVFDYISAPLKMSEAQIAELEGMLAAELKSTQQWRWILDSGVLQGSRQSSSAEQVAQLLRLYWHRATSRASIPLLIDDSLYGVDTAWREFTLAIIVDLARITQVILFTHFPVVVGESNLITLERPDHASLSLAFFRERYLPKRRGVAAGGSPKYVLGQRYPSGESKVCELKEVKGQQPLGSIKSLVDQYVVAFLNAGVRQTGKIVWGVRDEDRTIQGIYLTEAQCDELTRVVTEKLMQITPALAPTAYKIEIHNVSDGNKLIRDLYVLEIHVPSAHGSLLFATGRDEVYVKTDAGKRKLSSTELQMEVLRRHRLESEIGS